MIYTRNITFCKMKLKNNFRFYISIYMHTALFRAILKSKSVNCFNS